MRQFTFTVQGLKQRYNTVEEMRKAINKINNNGVNVDEGSIKIEYIEQPKTINNLVKLIQNSIDNKEDLEETLFVELVDHTTMKIVEGFSKGVQLSKNDFYTLTGVYGVYNYCNSIDEVKLNLIIDTITQILDGNKITYTNFKKLQLKNSL